MKIKLTKRVVDAAKPRDTRYVIWDSDTPGFGVRVNKNGSPTFVLKYFFQGRQRWLTLAKYGALTVEQARKEAIKALGGKAGGEDAVEKKRRAQADAMARSITLAEFCDDYMEDARNGLVLYRGVPKKASTLDSDQGRVERHLKPLLGRKLVADITPDDVSNFMDAVRLGKTATTINTSEH